MTYQPVFEVRDRSRYYKSPGVILPDGYWWNIWEIPTKQYNNTIETALKMAFELGYRAHVMQIQSKAYVDYVRFKND